MKLKYCSITGADDAVDPQALYRLSKTYPFAEWAILLLPARAAQKRFPTLTWIEKFKSGAAGLHTAMHLCDDGFLGFVAGRQDVLEIMRGFQRIQLNLKFGGVEGRYDEKELIARVRENPQHQFIIQYTPDKQGLLPLLKDVPHHAVLYDASAGRGIRPDKWDAPLSGHFCGYAGGLNPANVAENIMDIARVANGYETWIDMETGVRTDDVFDLAKVENVLKTVAASGYVA